MEESRKVSTTGHGHGHGQASSSTPPRLSLYSLPSHRPQLPGTAASPSPSPRRLPVSVPFKWEEAPGRPKKEPTLADGPPPTLPQARRLELPPRLAAAAAAAAAMAVAAVEETRATAVLDGRPSFLGSSRNSLEDQEGNNNNNNNISRSVMNSSSSAASSSEYSGYNNSQSSRFSPASPPPCSWHHGGGGGLRKEEARLMRNRSIALPSTSRLWASFRGRLSKVTPWRRCPKA